jgi:uncharacterized protein YbjT (DUF2867 family)
MTTGQHHVVLGGNGVVGRETVAALLRRGETTTSVGRHPSTVDTASSTIADFLDPDDVTRALAGAQVAYLTAGLPYSSSIWATQWPIIVGNSIDAAIAHGTHLVYFDNVYAYGPKFETAFGVAPTPIADGIAASLGAERAEKVSL